MNDIKVFPIGKIRNEENEVKVVIDPEYREGPIGLAGYSHVQVLWWADGCDNDEDRNVLLESKGSISCNPCYSNVCIDINQHIGYNFL